MRTRYKAIAVMAGGKESEIDYWHDKAASISQQGRVYGGGGWEKKRPPAEMVRIPGLVHETSTLYMSDDIENDKHASVDSLYRPYQCDNVYVTGGAIFPTSGSWNRKRLACR